MKVARRLAMTLCLVGTNGAGAAPVGSACKRESLDAFIVKAQSADKAAISDGRVLVGCSGMSAEAVQWLSFLLAYTGDRAASLKVDEPNQVLPSRVGRAKPAVITRARAGDYRELWARVDAGERGYAADPEALLPLARALARKALFNRSRDMYVTYLRLRPNDVQAEAEYLFTFHWEKDGRAAKARFEQAARRPVPPLLVGPLERGLALSRGAQALPPRGNVSPSQTTTPPSAVVPTPGPLQAEPRPDQVRGTVSTQVLRRIHRRDTAQVDYQGIVDASTATHRIQTNALAQDSISGIEARIGFKEAIGRFTLAAHGGYFSPEGGAYLGDVGLGVRLGQWLIGGQARRDALILDRPLLEGDAATVHDSLAANASFGRYFEATSTLMRDGDYGGYERHEATFILPIRKTPESDWFAVRIPASLSRRPTPHPSYEAPHRLETLAVGGEWEKSVSTRARLTAVADYGLARWRDAQGDARDLSFVLATAGATIQLSEATFLSLHGRHAWADDDALIHAEGWSSALMLSLSHGVSHGVRPPSGNP